MTPSNALYCSTAICKLPSSPGQVMDQWDRLCGEIVPEGVVLDARLDHRFQHEVLVLARDRGLSCPLLVHPLLGPRGLPAAAPSSADRDERRAAVEQLLLSAERAQRFGVPRLLLLPGQVTLSRPRAALVGRYERGAEPRDTVDEMAEERRARAALALDAICLTLEPTLRRLEPSGTTLLLPRPAPWPDQVPDSAEVHRLRDVFAGAPLSGAFVTDWWHLGRQLGTAPEPGSPQGEGLDRPTEGEPLAVADACGLTGGLPLGTGELDWSRLRPPGRLGPLVLTADADRAPRAAEIRTAGSLLRSWLATPD